MRKADTVADSLLKRIVSGELSPGTLLPREDEIAREYGVNRGVVREAMKVLEVHRLVRPTKRRGTEVLDPLASISPEVLRVMLVPEQGRVDPTVLGWVAEIRAHLDAEMSAHAAARRTDEDLAALDAALAGLRAASGSRETYAPAMRVFGQALARATQNQLYVALAHWHARILADLNAAMQAGPEPSEAHLQGLEHLVRLIRARDVQGARELVTAFHQWAAPRLIEQAKEQP